MCVHSLVTKIKLKFTSSEVLVVKVLKFLGLAQTITNLPLVKKPRLLVSLANSYFITMDGGGDPLRSRCWSKPFIATNILGPSSTRSVEIGLIHVSGLSWGGP